jgi:hypothetical protein
MLPFQLNMENGTDRKRQHSFVCSNRKTETANSRLFVPDKNAKLEFAFLGRQRLTVIDNCCFRKCAHLVWAQVGVICNVDS